MILSVLNSRLLLGIVCFRKKFPAERAVADVCDAKEVSPEKAGKAAGKSGE